MTKAAIYQYHYKLYTLIELANLAGVKVQTMYTRLRTKTVPEAVEYKKRTLKLLPIGARLGVRTVTAYLPNSEKGIYVYETTCECGLVGESRADVINKTKILYAKCIHKPKPKKKLTLDDLCDELKWTRDNAPGFF